MIKKETAWNKFLVCFCVVSFTFFVCSNLFAAKHALLIGIQDYPDTQEFRDRGLKPLSGPRNDVELIKNLLLAPPFEIPEENIKILLDSNATHTAIEEAFIDLRNRIKKNDFVYIHFSGHGSTKQNENPDDDDELKIDEGGKLVSVDQTLVPYKKSGFFSKFGKNNMDILDDEIREWIAKIGEITDQMVFNSDSCHSGTVSRGEATIGERAIKMDPQPYPKLDIDPISSGPPLGIRIGASKDDSSAYEINIGGKSYGRFTWHWVQALSSISPGETWGDVFQRAEAMMRQESITDGSKVTQNPQITYHKGDQDFKVLDGNFEKRSARIIVTAVSNNEVKLNVGLVSNVTQGSIYRIFTDSDNPQTEIPEIKITTVEPFFSKAKILKGSFKVGDLLVKSRHAYSFPPLRIVIKKSGSEKDESIFNRLADMLEKQLNFPELFRVERNTEKISEGLVIKLLRTDKQEFSQFLPAGSKLPVEKPDGELGAWVTDFNETIVDDTLRVGLSDPESGVKELVRKLKNYVEMQDIKKLKNDLPENNISIKVHHLEEDKNCVDDAETFRCFVFNNDGKYRSTKTVELEELKELPMGSRIGFSIENNTNNPYYFYLLNISVRDGVFVSFPPNSETKQYAFVRVDEKRKLPGGIFFPKPGREMIKVILTDERSPLDPKAFEFEGTETRYQISRGRGELLSPIQRLLNRTRRGTRGEEIEGEDNTAEPSKWGTREVQFEIK